MTNFSVNQHHEKRTIHLGGLLASMIFAESWLNDTKTIVSRLIKNRSGNFLVMSGEGKAIEEYIQYFQ